TQTLFDQAYGRVEASIQLPAGTAQGSGLWPAFWMLGSNINTVSWPACGEIDIMENIGQYNTATQNGGHIHGPVAPANGDYNGGNGVGSTFTFPAGQAANTGFHLYAAEWNPTSITFYVDGTAYQTLTAASLPGGGQWVFNHPFFIILNLAVGGAVGGPVGASFPQQMLVDYVRVYKLTSNGTGPYGGTAVSVPGTIQAENYDSYNDAADPAEPGEGFAYNGLHGTQTNGVYRTGEAVSTEACGDTGGTYDCDYTSPGQWMQYTINVTQAGSYNLDARVASSGQGGSFHFDVDGAPVTGELTCPNTGGWQSYQDLVATGVNLAAGTHQLLLVEDSMGA
ncbi:MAG TPA: family 16 glycosylhydrolase, partial [bacterium]|nr:family 16 glycosylhydrolase [bacterium]